MPQLVNDGSLPAAVFSRTIAPTLTRRYVQVETDTILDALAELGWRVTAKQSQRRNTAGLASGRSLETVPHMVRVRQRDDLLPANVGDHIPEIILYNAHDGTGVLQAETGLLTKVCTNGLCIHRTDTCIRIKHIGITMEMVLDAVVRLVGTFGRVLEDMARYDRLPITDAQAIDLATQAGRLRFPENVQFNPASLLRARFPLQDQPFLGPRWQSIQGNLINGGFITTNPDNTKSKTRKARAVGAIKENLALNEGLWELLDSFGNTLTPAVPYGWQSV